MPDITLRDCVHRLIRPHLTRRPDGKMVRQESLLTQLRTASLEQKQGGSSSSETQVPINLEADRILRRIDKTVRDESMENLDTRAGSIEALLDQWTLLGEDQHLTHVAMDLCDMIEVMFDPPPKPIPLEQACPDDSCGKAKVRVEDDGEWSSRPALEAHIRDQDGRGLPINDWTVMCRACGREWHGSQELAWLGRVLSDISARDTPDREGVLTTV